MPIAFDAVAISNAGVAGAPASWSHTCGVNANRFLLVAFDGTNRPTAVTYNGVALTKLTAVSILNATTGRTLDLWYLANPASGANTVALTGGTSFIGISLSYSGVAQDGFPDAGVGTYTGGGGSSTTQAGTVTTVHGNCWLVGFTDEDAGNATEGANTTPRQASVSFAFEAFDSNAARAIGSNSLNFVNGVPVFWSFIVVALAPANPSMLLVF